MTKLTPTDIFKIMQVQYHHKRLTGLEWNYFLDWFKSLLKIIFKVEAPETDFSYTIHDLENRLCVELPKFLIFEYGKILDKETNKYIKESFHINWWECQLIFKPQDFKTIEYFDNLIRIYKHQL